MSIEKYLNANKTHWNERVNIHKNSELYDLEKFKKGINKLHSLEREELGMNTEFILSDIYSLPEILNKKFDLVFTSYGVLIWLPDLKKWAEMIFHYLKDDGFFYIR